MSVREASPPPPASGRRLLQSSSNPDNITSDLGGGVSASIAVDTSSDVLVNLTVQVPYADRNNVTSIVQNAIDSGQVRRGLIEAGEPLFLNLIQVNLLALLSM